jgi:FtsP/CotA-like multicopper oxidase with cupredoxin domain
VKEEHREGRDVRAREGAYGQTGTGIAGEGVLCTRRKFLTGALTVSGLALSGLPGRAVAQPRGPVPPTANCTQEVQKIGEIRSQNGRLQAVITVRNEKRMLPADPQLGTAPREAMLRYFQGEDAAGNLIWPPASCDGGLRPPLPGPTLRARVGDQVEITYLNHVIVHEFPPGSIDVAETGQTTGCDEVTEATSGTKLYPGWAGDLFPNCFHGSSTTNMHFHGTHVTPDGLGDNVLLQLRPNPQVTAASVKGDFAKIFAAGPPAQWNDLPKSWRDRQLSLLKGYDDTAVWKGKRGTPRKPVLPPKHRLLPKAMKLIQRKQWPQYQIGAYPFCFRLTQYVEDAQGNPTHYAMGQCPGTHWYHAHKHGSTAINVLNGMAGVFVIEGDSYDGALVNIYPNLKQTEKVLIVQNFSDTPNLKRRSRSFQAPSLWVNGQLKPTITMRPGEIQLWRLVNASVRAVTTLQGFGPEDDQMPAIRQIAQDGVQFHYENYEKQPLLGKGAPRPNTFAPGNRVDILVKAPLQTGSYNFTLEDTTVSTSDFILTLKVEGEAIEPAMEFPTKDNYPSLPSFLADIPADKIQRRRELDFGWEQNQTRPRTGPGFLNDREPNRAPKFMINRKQFSGDRYDQTMVLGDTEEWKLTNSTSTIAHPFHIHVNPFQVVEIYDPMSGQTYKPTGDYIWQDVIAIPPSKLDENGNIVDSEKDQGYVKIRHRFVDFPGSYVLHCHMLAHEDRGMMQLVRVVPPGLIPPDQVLIEHH